MQESQRRYALLGAVSGALLVIVGAFGAHSLEFAEGREANYETGVAYHAYHTLALLAACALSPLWGGRAVVWAGRLWLAGIVLFSGSLYVLAATDTSWLGAVTPFGGVAFIAGWVAFAVGIGQTRT